MSSLNVVSLITLDSINTLLYDFGFVNWLRSYLFFPMLKNKNYGNVIIIMS
jgi:hypothetical protein